LKQACYELRASDTFWNIQAQPSERLIQPDGHVLGPKEAIVAIVQEAVSLRDAVLGRLLTKGQLFAVRVLPVNTYAAPGFHGRLGITLWNAYNNDLIIRPGAAIAKIEFVRLPRNAQRPYAGQHGYETQIWPVSPHYYANLESPALKKRLAD